MTNTQSKALSLSLIPVILFFTIVFGPVHAFSQQLFESPALAAEAFVDAVATRNKDALKTIFGDDWRDFIPIDEIREEVIEAFISAWDKTHRFKPLAYGQVQLAIGPEDWTLPIPIVMKNDRWYFDTVAGGEEMRTRRIGRNELSAIQAVLAYYDAQKEYAFADRNGDGMLEYARRLVSSPGKRDGLYWPVTDGEEESPLGPLVGDDTPGVGYYGYFYKILTGQGPNAPGGSYDYDINGRMSAGFALVAWPVDYGASGVMTFIISHNGQVFEKDFGPGTDEQTRAMARFDPDSSWKEVSP